MLKAFNIFNTSQNVNTLSLSDQSQTFAYAPTNTPEIAKKNSFYNELNKATTTIPCDHKVFICADFNARVGRTSEADQEWQKILGNINFGTGHIYK